jgi:hypothetical protein
MMIISCSNSDQKINKINIETKRIESIDSNKLISEIEVIPLETNDTSLISGIRKMIYWNNELFIFDRNQKQIMLFDIKGNFIRKLQRVGRGPGEYLDISDFAINPFNNNIEFVDGYNLYVYNNEFVFIEKVQIPKKDIRSINELEIINEEQILFMANGRPYIPVMYNRQDKKIVKLPEIYPSWLIEKMPFSTNDRFYRNGSILNYVEGFSNKVYLINRNGFQLKYEWDFGDFNFDFENSSLSDLIKSSTIQDIMNNSELFRNKYAISFRQNLENDKFILTSFFFKNQPASLLYNKNNGKYIFFNGKLSFLLFTSLVDFIEENKFIVIVDPEKLKNLPQEWFSAKSRKTIEAIDLSNNPVVLIFHLKPILLEN